MYRDYSRFGNHPISKSSKFRKHAETILKASGVLILRIKNNVIEGLICLEDKEEKGPTYSFIGGRYDNKEMNSLMAAIYKFGIETNHAVEPSIIERTLEECTFLWIKFGKYMLHVKMIDERNPEIWNIGRIFKQSPESNTMKLEWIPIEDIKSGSSNKFSVYPPGNFLSEVFHFHGFINALYTVCGRDRYSQ